MPPYDESAAVERPRATPLEELRSEFEYEEIEPGEPRKFRKVNYEKLKVVPLPALEKMQMLIDECEKYLLMPIAKDKYGTDHELRQEKWAEAKTRYPDDAMNDLRENNRIKINKMVNAQVLARHVLQAFGEVKPFPEDLEPLKESVQYIHDVFAKDPHGTWYKLMTPEEKAAFVGKFSEKVRAYLRAVT